ncbi:HPF/RaiA family ribosome-associated protein [Polaromonas sp.]|uniref:HPF/RaiA family ribosome-associated protein n=1 Tax=Polaromonas sp. TaxID=1869339 RepID=UPI0013B9977F|nr:HPF/RaiA family ribosome-associated protein [Polaromonas sp.]NDP61819.1 HPF/RaiA family ribosome-associated protein [Polaromonas sp.]
MQVIFESRDTEGRQFQALAEQRVRFVLRRLSWLVPQASIRLSDVNGPRGGIDKRCQVEFTTQGNGRIVSTAMAADWRAALEGALSRAARRIVRSVQRSQVRERTQPRQRPFAADL